MKKYLFLLQMSVFFTFSVSGQKIDTIACRMFESKLHVVENSFKYNKRDSSLQTGDAVMILSLLTGIPSESDGNYAGQTSPTLKIIENGTPGMFSIKRTSIGMTN
jgi:hypothetical protein